MVRPMRRFKQLTTKEEAETILLNGKSGVLAVNGDDEYPYTVPLSYAYEPGKIYFHSAKNGHKMDSIQRNPKVTFCVVGQDQVVPDKFTTFYSSVIIFGKAKIVSEEKLRQHAMELLVHKYSPGFEDSGALEIKHDWELFSVVEIDIEHLTGKKALELI